MNGEKTVGADVQMINSIRADAEAQADKILAEAKAAADAEVSKADVEAEAVRTDIVNRAKDKARRLCARGQALASVEARRILMHARETAVQKVFASVAAELSAIRANPETYRKSLITLAAEARRGIGSSDMRLSVAEVDRPIADAAFVEAVQAEAAKHMKIYSKTELSFDLSDSHGGCIARSRSGRIVFDNTYAQRFERAKRSLRSTILKEVPNNHE